MEKRYNIGYIDEDDNQVRIFTRALKDFSIDITGYNIHKGMTVKQILDQVYDSEIDLLMIDFYLKDKGVLTFNGDELARQFREVKSRFPMIIFTSNENDAFDDVDDPNIIYNKDMILEDGKTERFAQTLIKNIENYSLFREKRKKVISTLLEKGEAEGLSATDKDLLITAQDELINLDKTKKHEIPKHLISENKLEELSKTKKDAEAFLQSLIEKRKK